MTQVAAGIDLVFLGLFLALVRPCLRGSTWAVHCHAAAYWLLCKHQRIGELIWIEVLMHAAIGTLLVGWDSGFHYFLLMFISRHRGRRRLHRMVSAGASALVLPGPARGFRAPWV